jgi:hypothetical protein
LKELSRQSEIVEAISGKKRTDHKLYFSLDVIPQNEQSRINIHKIKELLGLKE